MLNAAARLVFTSPRRDHVSPLIRQLHWLKAPEQIQYKLAVLVYKCLNGMAPSYLADAFLEPAELTTRTRLRSASSFCSFAVHGCRLSATELFRWLLPVSGTVCRVMSPSLSVYRSRLKSQSSPSHDFYLRSACTVTLSFQTLNRFCLFCLYRMISLGCGKNWSLKRSSCNRIVENMSVWLRASQIRCRQMRRFLIVVCFAAV